MFSLCEENSHFNPTVIRLASLQLQEANALLEEQAGALESDADVLAARSAEAEAEIAALTDKVKGET